jgi:hypothetical protein
MKSLVASLVAVVAVVGCATDPASPEVDDGFRLDTKVDDGSGWSHAGVASGAGIGLSIDYVAHYQPDTTSYKPTHVDFADPVYANLWADGLTGDEQVTVVLMNYERCEKQVVPYTYSLDLTWYGDHFSGNLSHDAKITRSYLSWSPGTQRIDTRWSGYGGNHVFCQEVAFVVDGVWQVDPISNRNNFAIDMYAAR